MHNQSVLRAIAEHVDTPAHIQACANAVLYDLMHGPSWSLIPGGDVTRFNDDCLSLLREDLEDAMEPGDVLEQTYTGTVANTLREFIDELDTLYCDEDGFVSESEPQFEPNPDYTGDDDECEPEYFEPVPYYAVSGRDLIEALFGRTLAREFA